MRYVADDGTEFSTEKECLEYENNVNDIKKCFILYGDNLNELTEDSFDTLCYLHILEKPREVVTYLYHQYRFGFNNEDITESGIYLYDDFGMWRNVDNLITGHMNKAKSLDEIATKIIELSSKKIKEDLYVRTILFRAKTDPEAYYYAVDSKWVYGDYSNYSILYPNRPSILTEQDDYPVIAETVSQYIGLDDVEGTKIFEGDIIEFEDCGSEGYEYEEGFDYVNRASIAIVEGRVILDKTLCDNSGVCDDMSYYYDDFIGMLKHCKVIGNIWDNISLLQKDGVSLDSEEDV